MYYKHHGYMTINRHHPLVSMEFIFDLAFTSSNRDISIYVPAEQKINRISVMEQDSV